MVDGVKCPSTHILCHHAEIMHRLVIYQLRHSDNKRKMAFLRKREL
jgi:hypothetical protein